MLKRMLLACFLTSLFPIITSATIRPVVSLNMGSDRANVFQTKIITILAPFQNSYIATNHYDTETVFGFFLGGETMVMHSCGLQLGLSYYQTSSFAAKGNVLQFDDPAFNNFTYQ